MKEIISIFFYIIFHIYLLGASYMIIVFFTNYSSQQKIPTDLWTALGIVVTLTIAILIMNFIREKDYLDVQNKITNFEKEIENAKQLSSLPTILLDIATEENSNKEKWAKNYNNIKRLYKIGFIGDAELYRISIEAWKQDDIIFAFKLRKLAYELRPNVLKNKLYFLSILPYLDMSKLDGGTQRLYKNKDNFFREIGFVKKDESPIKFSTDKFLNKFHKIKIGKTVTISDESFAYALTGRYLYKKKQYDESKYFFNLAINISDFPGKRWHYRYCQRV